MTVLYAILLYGVSAVIIVTAVGIGVVGVRRYLKELRD